MKIVQINSVVSVGSTGRIAEHIGAAALQRGHESAIVYGRPSTTSAFNAYRMESRVGTLLHGVQSLFLDGHGLGSKTSTMRMIRWLEDQDPDIIGLHNIHGYYLNYRVLFDYLRASEAAVVWTLHDCWPFTGHCAFFDRADCQKWMTMCRKCPLTAAYPRSLLDFSKRNYQLKRSVFTGLKNLTIVTPSAWLGRMVGKSFLSEYEVIVIRNGVDLSVFDVAKRPARPLVLGVASPWSDRKGLADFLALRKRLPDNWTIRLVGANRAQRLALPDGIEGIGRTENREELVRHYQSASVFVNPTYSDNFPSTNLEALACGVPVVSYDTGGSPEAIDNFTGRVVPKGDVDGLADAILGLISEDQAALRRRCRRRAEDLFDQAERFAEYIDLFDSRLAARDAKGRLASGK